MYPFTLTHSFVLFSFNFLLFCTFCLHQNDDHTTTSDNHDKPAAVVSCCQSAGVFKRFLCALWSLAPLPLPSFRRHNFYSPHSIGFNICSSCKNTALSCQQNTFEYNISSPLRKKNPLSISLLLIPFFLFHSLTLYLFFSFSLPRTFKLKSSCFTYARLIRRV